MTIRVHLPQTTEGKAELAKATAAVHAGIIINKINELEITKEKKQALLDAVSDRIAKRKG
ncbi:MAG: hypothetical protein IKN17_12840 [Ruminococcus sp.]|nr:hypothetical protein [Ruminococcus sp.]